ncbi:MAG: diphthine--ammonia ligase [Candidatus Ratteibacteria bacterium]|jgi:uncharacterized protein (TIGR00290 family)
MRAFVSWSGGKDSSLSLYRIVQDRSAEITYFLNMTSEDGRRGRSHGINSVLLEKQAAAAGVRLLSRGCSWPTYEEEFKKSLLFLKGKKVKTGVFGDIDTQEHRDWVERVCRETGIVPILPLWKEERNVLMEEFLDAGFKAVVVSVRSDVLGEDWLGRIIDKKFVEDVRALGNVDICGENGEYHTFVFDGPIFKKPVDFSTGRITLSRNRYFLELLPK